MADCRNFDYLWVLQRFNYDFILLNFQFPIENKNFRYTIFFGRLLKSHCYFTIKHFTPTLIADIFNLYEQIENLALFEKGERKNDNNIKP